MSGRERMHKKGAEGVDLARLILESTTWIELPFDAADNETVCTLERLDGEDKAYDAMGFILREPKVPLYVESKNYDVTGNQGADFSEFLANAYSITARDLIRKKVDGRREFMWFTTHPFSLNRWSDLVSPGEIKRALANHPEVLDGEGINLDVLSIVSDRLWLINVHHKQSELTLSAEELNRIEALLNRKRRKK
ncbi:hypothetical protein KUG88_28320 [Rhodococcus rhodochrous]|uniref:hypothetical protein n=1 Tax=Rhodococcus rhodochrous TaxID=1829 RepID=UPI001E631075|nr:hypothetical protein [Rhodococcus rhodochrous]MCB8914009.1 hypothetical protein [Rhodococcus rhodochrous]